MADGHGTFDVSDFDITDMNINTHAGRKPSVYHHNPITSTTKINRARDLRDFEISEDAKSRTATPTKFGDILSPRISTTEVNRHFADFTQAGYDSVLDQSIELGRGKTRNLSFPYRRASESSENHERAPKVTDKKPTPKINDGKFDFVIPSGYRDDESFFANVNGKPQKAEERKSESKMRRKVKGMVDDMNMPDITGLSSIFSSDGGGAYKAGNSHKQIVSVPLDPDDQALFSAFGSFQKKIDALEKSRAALESENQRLNSRVSSMERETKQLKTNLNEELVRGEGLDAKARKYKAMAAAMKEQMDGDDTAGEYWKEQYQDVLAKLRHALDDKDVHEQDKSRAIEERDDAIRKLKEAEKRIAELESMLAAGKMASQSHSSAYIAQSQPTESHANDYNQREFNSAPLSPSRVQPVDLPPHAQSAPPPPTHNNPSSPAAQVPNDDIREIKEILKALLHNADPDFQLEDDDHEAEETLESNSQAPISATGSGGNDTIIETLQDVVEKLRTSKISEQPSTATRPSISSNRASAKPEKKTHTSDRRRVPRLVDRVIESLPRTCEVCSASGPKSPLWSSASCDHAPQTSATTSSNSSNRFSSRQHNPTTAATSLPAMSARQTHDWENEASIRPSSSAEDAVKLILDGMGKELAQLKEQYNDLTSEYTGKNPAKHRRKRAEVAESLRALVDGIEAKSDQIYALYDVMADRDIAVDDPQWMRGLDEDQEDVALGDGDYLGKHEWIKT